MKKNFNIRWGSSTIRMKFEIRKCAMQPIHKGKKKQQKELGYTTTKSSECWTKKDNLKYLEIMEVDWIKKNETKEKVDKEK